MGKIPSTPKLTSHQSSVSGTPSWSEHPPDHLGCEPHIHIRANDLAISYQGHPALQNFSLEIHKGCITALVGPSGCGKTSFLMSINRLTDLIPRCEVSGSLHLQGQDILAPTTNLLALRRTMGMIFQKPTVFPFSIRKNFELPFQEHGLCDQNLIDSHIEMALRQVGLWEEVKDRLHQPAPSLSGGQQQRLCLGRALALSPETLLLDEPCSALDPISTGIIEDLILNLRGQYSIIIVTHNLAQARRIADYVAFFWPVDGTGQLLEYGPAQSLFEAPQHECTASYISGARG